MNIRNTVEYARKINKKVIS